MSSNQGDIKGKDFIKNYQNAITNSLNYIIKTKQATLEIEKAIMGYKDLIKDFYKKFSQLKANFVNFFFDEKNTSKFDNELFPTINQNISMIKHIFDSELDSYSKSLNFMENNFIFSNKNEDQKTFLNQFNKNKSKNIDNKKIEKVITEFNNSYSKLMKNFGDCEEQAKRIYINEREQKYGKKVKQTQEEREKEKEVNYKRNTKFKKIAEETAGNEKDFKAKRAECEKVVGECCKSLESQLNEIENENKKYLSISKNLILAFLSAKLSNYNELKNIIEVINQDLQNNKQEKEISDFSLHKKKIQFNPNYIKDKEKYKIKSIHQLVTDNKIEYEKKVAINQIGDELGLGEDIIEDTLVLTEEDLYNVVEYMYKFDQIDKSEYNLETEKEKIDFKVLANKLLLYGLKVKRKEEFENWPAITDDEINKLYDGMNSKDFRLVFLQRLNNFRALGMLDMPKKEYDITSKCFLKMTDRTFEEKDKDSAKFLIIISQTFYIKEDGKKHYLQADIIGHKLFNDLDFWIGYTEKVLDDEISKIKNLELRSKKVNDIVFATLTTITTNMKSFGMDVEKVKKLCEKVFEKYESKKETKDMIMSMVNS